nr:predicted protein [Triticum aestivum]BDI54739.1 predicted protein [Triticum aestivum]
MAVSLDPASVGGARPRDSAGGACPQVGLDKRRGAAASPRAPPVPVGLDPSSAREYLGEQRKTALQAGVLGRERWWRRQEQFFSPLRLVSWMRVSAPEALGVKDVFLQKFVEWFHL